MYRYTKDLPKLFIMYSIEVHNRPIEILYVMYSIVFQLELIHDQLPLAVPCYDLLLVIEFTVEAH